MESGVDMAYRRCHGDDECWGRLRTTSHVIQGYTTSKTLIDCDFMREGFTLYGGLFYGFSVLVATVRLVLVQRFQVFIPWCVAILLKNSICAWGGIYTTNVEALFS